MMKAVNTWKAASMVTDGKGPAGANIAIAAVELSFNRGVPRPLE